MNFDVKLLAYAHDHVAVAEYVRSRFKSEKQDIGRVGLLGELFAMKDLEVQVPRLEIVTDTGRHVGLLTEHFWKTKGHPERCYAKVDVPQLNLEIKSTLVHANTADDVRDEASVKSVLVSNDLIVDRKGRSDDLRILQVFLSEQANMACSGWWTTLGVLRAYGTRFLDFTLLPNDLRRPYQELVAIIKHELE